MILGGFINKKAKSLDIFFENKFEIFVTTSSNNLRNIFKRLPNPEPRVYLLKTTYCLAS